MIIWGKGRASLENSARRAITQFHGYYRNSFDNTLRDNNDGDKRKNRNFIGKSLHLLSVCIEHISGDDINIFLNKYLPRRMLRYPNYT